MKDGVELVEIQSPKTEPVSNGDSGPVKASLPNVSSRRNPFLAYFSIACVLVAIVVVVAKLYLQAPEFYEGGDLNGEATQEEMVGGWLDATVTLKDGVMFDVTKQLRHDEHAFTEGLTFANGMLYESTGLTGQSELRTIDKDTGEILEKYPMSNSYFGEGLTYARGKLYQLTWKANVGFIYDANNLSAAPETFTYSSTNKQGWGLTYDAPNHELIQSDGSEYLHFLDPDTLKQKRKIKVTRQFDVSARKINELEFWRGRVLANIWYEDTIIVVDPATGMVEKEYDFSSLWPLKDRKSAGADVLNGISVSETSDLLYITGKDWDRMFLVSIGINSHEIYST